MSSFLESFLADDQFLHPKRYHDTVFSIQLLLELNLPPPGTSEKFQKKRRSCWFSSCFCKDPKSCRKKSSRFARQRPFGFVDLRYHFQWSNFLRVAVHFVKKLKNTYPPAKHRHIIPSHPGTFED